MSSDLENQAQIPVSLEAGAFNEAASLPYGLALGHLRAAMGDFLDFLGFVNQQLGSKGMQRLETILMPANFSSIVGEFMSSTIPKYCTTMVKNRYHNGHPDLIPAGLFPGDAAQHVKEGVEIKASRYSRAWQGHNPEDVWLMVFVFDSSRPRDTTPKPFRFVMVAGAQLATSDWVFSGRSETSRRTITASVTETGYQKMMSNWIYKA